MKDWSMLKKMKREKDRRNEGWGWLDEDEKKKNVGNMKIALFMIVIDEAGKDSKYHYYSVNALFLSEII